MRVALVDNGSLEPAAHAGLRAAAARIGEKAGMDVAPVSWRHSDRIPAAALGGDPAWTLAPWIRAQFLQGEREFVLIPFFISPQGAIGSLLHRDLEALRAGTGYFDYEVTSGLDAGTTLPAIVIDRVRAAAVSRALGAAPVVVVDHGGPSSVSVRVRDQVAAAVRQGLGADFGPVAAASMEAPESPRSPLGPPLAQVLASPGFNSGDVLIAPLFLLPGRHAGPGGDLGRIAREAQQRSPALRCHFTELVGTHPLAIESLASALGETRAAGTPS